MSDLSLLTGVYVNVEAYGTLIDRVIQQLGQEEGRSDRSRSEEDSHNSSLIRKRSGFRVPVARSINARQSAQDKYG